MNNGNGQEKNKPSFPNRINRLYELANNLWWSWNEIGRQVFRSLDYALWRTSSHNPVKQLREISYDKLELAAKDPAFLELYDSTMQKFDKEMSSEVNLCYQKHPQQFDGKVAYFSAEYAIHSSLPIYAGGLGALAGDICKEASDIGLPFVAVGFMYPQGYFHQHVSAEGEQQEVYAQLDFNEVPISPCAWPTGCGPLIPIQLGDRELFLKLWQVNVGRVKLYLLDTNVKENTPQDRRLSARLYTADMEERLRQLIVLGVGGVRALRELGINPVVWHANEDHTAFMILERLREEREKGVSFDTAIENIRKSTVFTTHTPVPSGHHIFPDELMDRYSKNFWGALRVDRDTFLKLGRYDVSGSGKFSLTAFALRLSIHSNAVSRLHFGVTKNMWRGLWPNRLEAEIPISYITNGVHLPSWQAPEITKLCQKSPDAKTMLSQTDREFWQCVVSISDQEFWRVRQLLKYRLMQTIQYRAQKRWMEDAVTPQQVIAMGSMLDPYALTLAFARRFTEYKRPTLILSDIERLKKLVTNPLRPVQIIFAGKSHPADIGSKQLLKRVYKVAADHSFLGRIVFVEDYDMRLARDLVRGVDVWLNNPRRLQEACGTSGMKASMNGVINLSVRDGWWDEAYDGNNGWVIDGFQGGNPDEEDKNDAESLYNLLEKEVVPLFYDRDRTGVPHSWIKIAKEAIRTVSPEFNACRMMKEYTQRMYEPAANAANNK